MKKNTKMLLTHYSTSDIGMCMREKATSAKRKTIAIPAAVHARLKKRALALGQKLEFYVTAKLNGKTSK